jgi:dephospho-CoA kinase
MARDRLDRAAAEVRLLAQQSIDEKASRADLVVANDGPVDLLAEKARRLLDDVTRGVAQRLPNAPPARY